MTLVCKWRCSVALFGGRLSAGGRGLVVHPAEMSVEGRAWDAGLGGDLGHGQPIDVAEVAGPVQASTAVGGAAAQPPESN